MTGNKLFSFDAPTKNPSDGRKHLEQNYHNRINKLISADGEELHVSDNLFKILREILPLLETGRTTVTISPNNAEMTTQEAADFLNVSRPYLIKLLDCGDISYTRTGSHRRIKVKDVMEYKQKKESQRYKALGELTSIMQEHGLFD